MTITEFTIDPTFKFITLKADTETAATFSILNIFIGSDYLKPLPVDLSDKLTPAAATLDTTITLAELGLDADGILDGIFTVYLEDTTTIPIYIEAAIANLYYVNLCLANMIVANNAVNGWNDLNTIYLLIKAIGIYLPINKIEQALNCYERVVAMMENNPKYLVTTDITPCLVGSGCWIINGTYVIN